LKILIPAARGGMQCYCPLVNKVGPKTSHNFLENDPALNGSNPDTDFRLLYSFFLAMNGRFQEFLYQTREASVVKQALADS
jgi:hypothetical protein